MDSACNALFAFLLLLGTWADILCDPCPMLCLCKKTPNVFVFCNEQNSHFQEIPRFPEATSTIEFSDKVEVVSLKSNAFSTYEELRTVRLQLKSLQIWEEEALGGLYLLDYLKIEIHSYSGNSLTRGYFRDLTSLRLLYLTLQLTVIPDVICDLPNLRSLLMPRNRFSLIKIPPCFRNLQKLNSLQISDNHITAIDAFDFANLPSDGMTSLVMNRNMIHHISSSSLAVFTNLKILSLSRNKLEKGEFLSKLASLEELTIDQNQLTDIPSLHASSTLRSLRLAWNANLNVNFSGVSNWCEHLLELDISGRPLHELKNTIFVDLILCSIRTLKLHDCKVNSIEENTFSPLQHMETLNLMENHLTYLQVETALLGTSGTLHYLQLDNNPLKKLQSTIFRYVKHSHLTTISLRHCFIQVIEEGTFGGLMNLTIILLNDNELTILTPGAFQNAFALRILSLHGNRLAHIASAKILGLPPTLQEMDIGQNGIKRFEYGDLEGYHNLSKLDISENLVNYIKTNALRDLGNLRILVASSLQYGKTNIFDNLQFTPKLEELDMENNDLMLSPEATFIYFPHRRHIRRLNLANNPRFGETSNTLAIIFRNMSALTKLTLSRCGISTLPTTMWHGTSALQFLDINSNSITTWQPQMFLPLTNLTTLMASDNKITFIDKDMFKYLPKLQILILGHNPFACDCHLLWFSDWAHLSGIHLRGIGVRKVYQCASPPEEKGNWILEMTISQTDCQLHWKTKVILSATIPLSFILMISIVVYYFRWYFRYLLFIVRSHRRKYKLEIDQGQYDYDVFVAYNQVDRFWVIKELLPHLEYEAGFKLCIHHRDWLVGMNIAENIQESVNQSRKTIAVLTNSFALSKWCQLELTFAHGRLLDGVKDSLLLVLLEDIEPRNQTALLRHLLTRSNYLAWPHKDNAMQDNFWRILRRSIRRPNRLLDAVLPDIPRAYGAT